MAEIVPLSYNTNLGRDGADRRLGSDRPAVVQLLHTPDPVVTVVVDGRRLDGGWWRSSSSSSHLVGSEAVPSRLIGQSTVESRVDLGERSAVDVTGLDGVVARSAGIVSASGASQRRQVRLDLRATGGSPRVPVYVGHVCKGRRQSVTSDLHPRTMCRPGHRSPRCVARCQLRPERSDRRGAADEREEADSAEREVSPQRRRYDRTSLPSRACLSLGGQL